MSRRHPGVSRPLVAAMAVVLAIGATIYLVKHHHAKQAAAAEVHTAVAESKPASPAPAPADTTSAGGSALVTQTPMAAAPTVAPMGPTVTLGGATPTTAPSAVASTQPATPLLLPANAPAALAEGKAKLDAGELVAGRKILNDALLSGALSPEEQTLAKQLISQASDVLVFSPRRFANDPFESTHTVQRGEKLQSIANAQAVTWEFLLHINDMTDARKLRAGATLKTIQGPFHAVVTKHAFTVDLYLGSPGQAGSMYVTTVRCGLGQNDSTPTGTWMAGGKLKNPAYFSPRGEGVIAAGDPKNPLGAYWISLQGIDGQAVGKMSYGIHGTIEPDSIGKQSSMGCIRLANDDIKRVYELLVDGKSIIVVKE